MNENNIDSKVKDFSNYLLDIGLLIGGNIYNEFGKKYKEINEKEKILLEDEEPDENYDLTYFKDNISKTMIKFYESLNEEKKKLITFSIFNNYNKRKEKNNTDTNYHIDKNELLAVSEEDEDKIDDKNNSNNIKNIEYKEEHFEIELLSLKNNLILKLSDISEDSSKENFNKFKSKKKKKKEKNNIIKKKNKKREEEKEKEKLLLNENCTFQPNLDKKSKKINKVEKKNITEIFLKLSQKSKKKEEEIENIRKEIDKECLFQPNLESNKNKSKKKINRKDFEKRLKLFEENRKDKEEKRKKEDEKEFNEKFPFIPNKEKERNKSCNKSFNKSFNKKRNESFESENIYQRLHDEKNKIKLKYEENVKKILDEIKDRANHPIVKHNNINYITNRRWNREPERRIYNIKNMSFDKKSNIFYNTEENKEDIKMFNNKKIEELYEEYKKMKNDLKVEQIQKENEDLNKTKEENKEKININISNNEENNKEKNKEENNNLKNKDEEKKSKNESQNNSLDDTQK